MNENVRILFGYGNIERRIIMKKFEKFEEGLCCGVKLLVMWSPTAEPRNAPS